MEGVARQKNFAADANDTYWLARNSSTCTKSEGKPYGPSWQQAIGLVMQTMHVNAIALANY